MSVTLLEQPVTRGGIASVNFFNGRLLTGRDLTREQEARATADQRVAQAVGSGVAQGLEISRAGGLVLRVTRGVAVSRSGRTLWLNDDVSLDLSATAPPRAARARAFDACETLRGGTYGRNPGIYLLTLAPIPDAQGQALTNALDDAAVPCNTDVWVQAVRFRLLPLDALLQDEIDAIDARATVPTDAQRVSLLRNRIAHRCFGTDTLAAFIADPLGRGPTGDYGLLSALPASTFSACDAPLAVVRLALDNSGAKVVDFADMWAVRRRITRPSAGGSWSLVTDDRREAEAEACFMQFQGQVAEVGSIDALFKLRHYFDFLPPFGLLAVDGGEASALSRRFDGLTVRGPAFIEGARFEPLLRSARAYPPIGLSSGELIWLYRVRENQESRAYGIQPLPQACTVFTSGHMPYFADSRIATAHWQYANTTIDR